MQTLFVRTLAVATILIALPLGSALANSVRVEGLVGDPRTGMTYMFLDDDTGVFLNPALVSNYSSRISLNLGVGAGNGVTLEPMGGVMMQGDTVSFGIFLNREANRYSDQSAVATALIANPLNTPTYLPIDAMVAFNLGDVSIGVGFYGAFGGSSSLSEDFFASDPSDPDDRDDSVVTENSNGGHYISASVGVSATVGDLSPQGWFRFTSLSDWEDSLSYLWSEGPDGEPENHFTDLTTGLTSSFGISGGFRMPVELQYDLTLVPAVSAAYATTSPFINNRLADLDVENDVAITRVFGLTAGVGLQYRPTERVLAVFSVSGDASIGRYAFDNFENGDEFYQEAFGGDVVHLPVITVGAEAKLLEHLKVRGCIRAGMAVGLTRGSEDFLDEEGILSYSDGTANNADPQLSAAAGISLPFEELTIDLTVGGDLLTGEESGSFFSQAGLTVNLP
ncbi:MAG: hypothetical protein VX498_11910 [Myxococcota bacterium]|nr:hypothetical protein [Myxococcota bacterium]